MASTLLKLVCLVQLVPLALTVTNSAVKTKDLKEDDLDTEETGWIFQEKARQLENIKNKLISPLSVLKPPSPSYGRGYPNSGRGYSYTSSANIQPSYSFGVSYPSYNSGWSSSNSFKKSPVNHLDAFFNKGSYYQTQYNYAPDCYYQTTSKPTPTYNPERPYVTYGTPLYSYYNKPSVTYGSNFGFSSQAAFASELSKQTQFQPSSSSAPLLVKSSIFPPASIHSEASYPLSSYPVSSPSVPSSPTLAPPQLVEPAVPHSPPLTPSVSTYPGSPSWSPVVSSYSASPIAPEIIDASTPVPPLWSGLTPTFPSSPPQNPSTPSPPWSSLAGSSTPVPVSQEFLVVPSSSSTNSLGQDIAIPQEVLITPSPLQTSGNIDGSPPGPKNLVLNEQYPINSEPPFSISTYPNVLYITNGLPVDNPASIQPIGEHPNQPIAIGTPESSILSTEGNSRPSSRAQPTNSDGSVKPVLTTIYTSNTIDQTRIPVLPQTYVQPYRVIYPYYPQVVPNTYSVPYSFGFRGSLGLQGSVYKSIVDDTPPVPLNYGYGEYKPAVGQWKPIIQKTC